MAIAEALRVIEQSWADLEPRLTVRELAALARLPLPLVEPEDALDLAEALFRLLGPALPRYHPAWEALLDTGTRFSPGSRPPEDTEYQLARRFIARAREAMDRPSIVENAAADFLLEATARFVLRNAVVRSEPITTDRWLIESQIDGRWVYPNFQFISVDPLELHPVVQLLHERLGGYTDDLGAVMWWLTPNSWLGRAPADLLGTGRDPEIEYAADQLINDSW